MVTNDDKTPDEIEDRDLELEEDDDQGEEIHEINLEDLPEDLRAEIEGQIEQVKKDTETYQEEDH